VPESFLYKYRMIDDQYLYRTKRIFTNNEAYFTPLAAFNDPFDCQFRHHLKVSKKTRVNFLIDALKDAQPELNREQRRNLVAQYSPEEMDERLDNALIGASKGTAEQFRIYCLTSVPDDILMWSHYANSHRGFCLKFRHDTETAFFRDTAEIQYEASYPVVNVFESDRTEQYWKAITTKSKHWEYEKEWRIIKMSHHANIKRFPGNLLVGVIFGCKMSEDHKTLIREWCAGRKTPMQFFQARQSETKYEITLHEIEPAAGSA